MNWEWSDGVPGKGSSRGIQRLRMRDEDDPATDLWDHPAVTWIDPGGDTGIATVWFLRDRLEEGKVPLQQCLLAWEADFLSGTENFQTLQALRWIAERSYGPHAVGIEDFVLASFLPGREVLSPVRIGHKIDYQLWRGIKAADGRKRAYDVAWQSANDAKHTVTDARLKEMAMYTPGLDHARDATRHCVLWLRKLRQSLIQQSRAAGR